MDILKFLELGTVLGDGAMGTMLQLKGLKMGECPEAWNLDHAEIIEGIHGEYRDAGSDFLTSNTFGANPIKLARHGLESHLEDMVTRGVDAARRAAGDKCLVAGSLGPTGVLLEPYGDTPAAKMKAAFYAAAQALDRAGVDFLLVETMTDINEARLAVEAAREVSSRPVAATMAFAKGAKGYRTVMGTSPEDAARHLAEAGADIVGTNCVGGVAEAVDIMKIMVPASTVPTLAQPNAGLPEVTPEGVVYPETPERMAAGLKALLATGVRAVGGCCGTTPAHIQSMASFLGKV
jgi:5-methyltetrahydrofolate--homocysteine methyltransferase